MQNNDNASLIKNWIEHTKTCEQMIRDKFDSIDVEEITNNKLSQSDQIELSLKLYEQLIIQIMPQAHTLMAMLVFSLEYSDELQYHTFDEIVKGESKLRQPPELYLIVRSPHPEKYVLEEYKRAFLQKYIDPSDGVIYSYYKSSCDDDDSFMNDFYFEHHLVDRVTEIGAL